MKKVCLFKQKFYLFIYKILEKRVCVCGGGFFYFDACVKEIDA